MNKCRPAMVVTLIACLLAGGCQSDSLPDTVVEYRPPAQLVTKEAFDAGVFVLWRWVPVAPVVGDVSAQPAKSAGERPVEVRQVYIDQGSPVGFGQSNGQLIAIAGPTTLPLEKARYAWTALTASNEQSDARSDAVNFWVTWTYWTNAPVFYLLALTGAHFK